MSEDKIMLMDTYLAKTGDSWILHPATQTFARQTNWSGIDKRRASSSTWTASSYDDSILAARNPTGTSAELGDHGLAQLQITAYAGQEQAFVRLCADLDWSKRSAEDYLYIARLALRVGAYLTAREIVTRGAAIFPNDSHLKRMAHVLAPPQVNMLPVNSGAAVESAANFDWIKRNGSIYSGNWVALKNGTPLAVAKTVKDVISQLGGTPRQSVLLTRIP